MTLIETLAALLLLVLLTSALAQTLHVLQTFDSEISEQASGEWQLLLRQRLERDLFNTSEISIRPDHLILRGNFATSELTGRSLLVPSEVHYRVDMARHVLIRQSEIGRRIKSEPMALDIGGILAGHSDERHSELRVITPDSQQFHAIPQDQKVVILASDGHVLLEIVPFPSLFELEP